jgi:hypothetical protein
VILFPNVNCPKIAIQREMERRGLKGVKVWECSSFSISCLKAGWTPSVKHMYILWCDKRAHCVTFKILCSEQHFQEYLSNKSRYCYFSYWLWWSIQAIYFKKIILWRSFSEGIKITWIQT